VAEREIETEEAEADVAGSEATDKHESEEMQELYQEHEQ
jgi:hypothetical protein